MSIELCEYYEQLVDSYVVFLPGTIGIYLDHAKPARHATEMKPTVIRWQKNRISTDDLRFDKPKTYCPENPCPSDQLIDVDKDCVPEKWIPVDMVVSPQAASKNKREAAQRRVEERQTRSNESSTLTRMLPLVGRPVRQTQVRLSHGYPRPAPNMTHEPELFYTKVLADFSKYSDDHVAVYRYGPHM